MWIGSLSDDANMTAQHLAPDQPSLHHVDCPGASRQDTQRHRMAFWRWGDAGNPRVLLCVHGLSRQGRDFDVLARRLAGHYQVICPDVVGRGHSDWLADPQGYQVFTYASDMVALLQQLRQQLGASVPLEIDWVGTSMGGLIGLAFSSVPTDVSGVQIRRFVMNDVGPRLRHDAILRIGDYLGQPRRFVSEQEAADYLWSISSGFGPHSPQQWLDLCRPLLRPAPDGQGLVLHYDGVSWAARKLEADVVIDAATLTGAQLVATGLVHAAVVSNDEALEQLAVRVGRACGDLCHPLPFAPELYRHEFSSPVADLRNSVANRNNAQASCAAQFIYEHLADAPRAKTRRWCHIDLAGPAFPKDRGTGFGVALVTQLVRSI